MDDSTVTGGHSPSTAIRTAPTAEKSKWDKKAPVRPVPRRAPKKKGFFDD